MCIEMMIHLRWVVSQWFVYGYVYVGNQISMEVRYMDVAIDAVLSDLDNQSVL